MSFKIDDALQDQLAAILNSGMADEAIKAFTKRLDDAMVAAQEDIMWRLKDELAQNLAAWVADMAQRAVEMMLEGNEDQMRRYLSCDKRGADGQYSGWTGRSDSVQYGRKREAHEWHSVIHGKLFEQGAVALRKQIVDAHRDLLVNERILDLEDQVKALVAQNNRLNDEKDRLSRVRDLAEA